MGTVAGLDHHLLAGELSLDANPFGVLGDGARSISLRIAAATGRAG
jgi:hypothetical protein